MNIAIIHHHLHPGGVTRIIESQVNALRNVVSDIQLTIVTGDTGQPLHATGNDIQIIEEEIFRYLAADISKVQALSAFQKITKHLKIITGQNDILHLHNLNLGKNPLLTLAVCRMAGHGMKIVNHCHDFAEDRPDNYSFLKSIIEGYFQEKLPEILYPPYDNYHYVVLTSGDYKRLAGYGINPERISLLPNPVAFCLKENERIPQDVVKEKLDIGRDLKICLYPVRAIHRKNIGEFILLSVLFRNQASWLITQPPQNPVEKPEYDRWKKFCSMHHIPVLFEAGKAIDIHELMPAADLCISTSMMEGFGLAFMEPWLAGIPVIGRDIEHCTADLKRNGIQFPLLYDRFIVSFNGEKTDFKDLDQKQQQQIIQDVLHIPGKGKEIAEFNPFLNDFLNPVKQDIIRNNQQVIRERYSLESYGQQLHGIYKKLLGRA